jgi:2'-5' RNA ligase
MICCIAALLDDETQNLIRRRVYDLNCLDDFGIAAALLPQHISLRTAFHVQNIAKIEEYFDSLYWDSRIRIISNGVEIINEVVNDMRYDILWYTIREDDHLRGLHQRIADDLSNRLEIKKSAYDGDLFRFHAPILYTQKSIQSEILEKLNFLDFETTIEKIALFVSHENPVMPGRFYVYKIRRLNLASN